MSSQSKTAQQPVSGKNADKVFKGVAYACGILILVVLAAVALFLLFRAWPLIGGDQKANSATISNFTGGKATNFWGYVGPLLFGTVLISALALLISFFVSVGIALFISHYAPKKLATALSYVVDLLAAIPSVIYGLWGGLILVPAIYPFWNWVAKYLGWIPLFQGPAANPSRTVDITVVHRSDKSGTTKNFLSYVKDAAGDAWSYELGENWPNEVGQGAKGTSGVISTVQQADGTIGYADASQAGELGTVAVKVGDDYVPFSAEAAAKVVDASPLDESATGDNRVVVKLDHNTTEKGAYPIVLVSYDVACPAYKDANTAKFVKSWLTYVVSDEGQQTAASAAGSAPLSDTMRQKVLKSIDAIETK